MQRTAKAVWDGDLKTGTGTIDTGSGALRQRKYNFVSRFEDGQETNPEELLAAAHAGCFSMAVVAELGRAGVAVQQVATQAKVTMERIDGKPTITAIALHMSATAPGSDRDAIQAAAEGARAGCVISRALAPSITVTLTTSIEV
ncbi:MAG: OsmC family peroxiredoxin [Nannocystaceae bacterium]|nr:OsmC family peroxiredoxin [Nannocystaceae bacterium]